MKYANLIFFSIISLSTSMIIPTTESILQNDLSTSNINNCIQLIQNQKLQNSRKNIKNCISIIGNIFKEVASDKMACWVNANQVCPTQLSQICGAMCISEKSSCATFITEQISKKVTLIDQSIKNPLSLIGNIFNEITYLSSIPKCDIFTMNL